MCVTPSHIYVERAGQWMPQTKACGDCWQCKQNLQNDYIGRCLCEAFVSDWTVAVTLTYRDRSLDQDAPLAAEVIHPPHFQNFVRAVRKRGHKIRYFGCGEYGERKGRAHFHCVIFGKGKRPLWPQKVNFHNAVWPHGHMFADWDSDEKSFQYVAKYVTKELDENGGQAWFTLSKKPALGHEWFMRKAANHVVQGVFPRGFTYTPPGASRKKPYMMRGAIKRDFLGAVLYGWENVKGIEPHKRSEWVRAALEKFDRDEFRRWHEEYRAQFSLDEVLADMAEAIERERISDRAVIRALLDSADIWDSYCDEKEQRQNAGTSNESGAPTSTGV